MNDKKTGAICIATVLTAGLAASPALAHTGGHGVSLMAGFAHPLLGVDHLLAMLAVGVWAAIRPAKTGWQGPLLFLAAIAAGAVLGTNGLAISVLEPGIVASVVLLGLMVASGRHLPVGAGLLAIAGFALLHGQAHGLEAGAGSATGFIAGMLVTTAGLHIAGYLAGRQLQQFKYGAWIAGSVIAAGGLALITT